MRERGGVIGEDHPLPSLHPDDVGFSAYVDRMSL